MNLPNLLTCSRLVLTVIFTVFLFSPEPSGKWIALGVFVTASFTDYLDGVLARRWKETSQFGKLMDPIADKMLTLSAFFSFWALGLLSLWMVLVVAARDLIVTVTRLRMRPGSEGQGARGSGKKKTVLQLFYIIAVLVYLAVRQSPQGPPSWDGQALLWIRSGMFVIVLFTLWSGARVLIKKTPSAGTPQ